MSANTLLPEWTRDGTGIWAMSQAVRARLGQNGNGEHPDYRQDMGSIAAAIGALGLTRVAALGPEGSNSHAAAVDLSTAVQREDGDELGFLLPARMGDVLDAAGLDGCVSIVPVTNVASGEVRLKPGTDPMDTTLGQILERKFTVLGVFDAQVVYDLLAKCTRAANRYRRGKPTNVESKIDALIQCSNIIRERGLAPVETHSTAGAAQALARRKLLGRNALVIAPPAAGKLHGLKVVQHNIGDLRYQNITTMVAVAAPGLAW